MSLRSLDPHTANLIKNIFIRYRKASQLSSALLQALSSEVPHACVEKDGQECLACDILNKTNCIAEGQLNNEQIEKEFSEIAEKFGIKV